MERYSPSRLKAFEACPLQYKFKYVEKIPVEQPESFDINFGLTIHEFAELYNGENKNELLSVFKKYKLDEAYKACVLPTVKNFFGFFERNKQYPYETEKEYEYKCDDYWLYGIIDRYMTRPEDIVVVDYKTAKNPNRSRYEFQMKCYSLLVSKLQNIEPQKIKTLIYFPRPNKEEYFSFSNTEIELFEKEIINKIKTIETNTDWKACSGFHCKWCGYSGKQCSKRWRG